MRTVLWAFAFGLLFATAAGAQQITELREVPVTPLAGYSVEEAIVGDGLLFGSETVFGRPHEAGKALSVDLNLDGTDEHIIVGSQSIPPLGEGLALPYVVANSAGQRLFGGFTRNTPRVFVRRDGKSAIVISDGVLGLTVTEVRFSPAR